MNYVSNLAKRVIESYRAQTKHPKEAAIKILKTVLIDLEREISQKILEDSFEGKSTSMFHNAVGEKSRDAHCYFYRMIKTILDFDLKDVDVSDLK